MFEKAAGQEDSFPPHIKNPREGGQMIDKPIVENLGCMKGPQPLHFLSAGGGVYVAEEKNSGAELAPAEEFFIPLKFSGCEPLGEQENLQSVKSDPSLFTEASALPMR